MYYRPDESKIFENHSEIRAHFKSVSFPPSITDAALAEFGVLPVSETEQPTASSPAKIFERSGIEQDSSGNWVTAWAERGKTPAEAAEQAAADIIAAKLSGIEILGVMCSATKTDQSGLSAVALGVTLARMANSTFPDTKFEFENGNSLVVTNANFDTIYAAWMPFRQSFFTP